MKTAVLGDTHGRNLWKQVNVDQIIFLGDYFDSFDIGFSDQINNFYDIIEYKKHRKDEVILLLGNHDYHYMPWSDQRYSGYQDKYDVIIRDAFGDNIEYFQVGYEIDHPYSKFLFTHAGVTKTWWKNTTDEAFSVELLNDFLIHRPTVFGFQYNKNKLSGTNAYGNNIFQGPLWVRPDSLVKDGLEKYTHIVGHTPYDSITVVENFIFTDTMASKKYLLFDNDVILTLCLD